VPRERRRPFNSPNLGEECRVEERQPINIRFVSRARYHVIGLDLVLAPIGGA
jgi:hypothetical protein